MGSAITTQLDDSRIRGALEELARLNGKDFEAPTRAEAGKALEEAMSRTDAAQLSLINQTKNPEWRAQKIAARGLQKKVWAQLASKLGLQLSNVPEYVYSASTPRGDYPEDAEGRLKNGGTSFALEGSIFRSYWPGIFSALSQAMESRRASYRSGLRDGVFDKAEAIARKYPGMSVNRSVI